MNLADELQRRGIIPLKREGRRLIYFGVLNLPGDMSRKEQALKLHQEGLSEREVAAVMKISRSCARNYILRAQRKLSQWPSCTNPSKR